mmetsp:Transcript_16197/g.49000  ORF Transcript_16197/g.49000 Transcript_16197/m.49000 type:complete len:204 (+) Transcript_16197:685-1296(+)
MEDEPHVTLVGISCLQEPDPKGHENQKIFRRPRGRVRGLLARCGREAQGHVGGAVREDSGNVHPERFRRRFGQLRDQQQTENDGRAHAVRVERKSVRGPVGVARVLDAKAFALKGLAEKIGLSDRVRHEHRSEQAAVRQHHPVRHVPDRSRLHHVFSRALRTEQHRLSASHGTAPPSGADFSVLNRAPNLCLLSALSWALLCF